MKKTTFIVLGLAATFCFGFSFNTIIKDQSNMATGTTARENITPIENDMKLGAFSMSLSVKDLKTSRQFYEKLGFTAFGGSMEQNYLIMKNENALIGLFQGMFEGNIITFNPGWNENAKNVEPFDDVREIQRRLKATGTTFISEADEKTSGPASLMIKDPDGNVVLIDQHR